MNEVPRVLVLQHVACESLGTIQHAFDAHGLHSRSIRIHKGEPVPASLEGASALVIMGGPMSVYDSPRLDHLGHEFRLIEAALAAERPILGVCLGSQLLAHVLGAKVYPGSQKEIGWHEVTLSASGRDDPLWTGVPSAFQAFHWHGDIFDQPAGCESLAASELTRVQSFRYGISAYGILFHMEVTRSIIEAMAATFPEELQQSGGHPAGLLQGANAYLNQLTAIGDQVFGRWAAMVQGRLK